MKNYNESVVITHSLNWPYIHDHPYRISTIGGSESSRTNILLNLVKYQRPNYLLMEEKKQELKH